MRFKYYDIEIIWIPQVPLSQRSTIHGTADAIGVPNSTLFEQLKSVIIQSHSSYLNPTLTADNFQKRVEFSLDHINIRHDMFTYMFDEIYVDEKRFYLTQ